MVEKIFKHNWVKGEDSPFCGKCNKMVKEDSTECEFCGSKFTGKKTEKKTTGKKALVAASKPLIWHHDFRKFCIVIGSALMTLYVIIVVLPILIGEMLEPTEITIKSIEVNGSMTFLYLHSTKEIPRVYFLNSPSYPTVKIRYENYVCEYALPDSIWGDLYNDPSVYWGLTEPKFRHMKKSTMITEGDNKIYLSPCYLSSQKPENVDLNFSYYDMIGNKKIISENYFVVMKKTE